jgi:hypothetical protein
MPMHMPMPMPEPSVDENLRWDWPPSSIVFTEVEWLVVES